ncbi:MAG: CPBP family intramembrane metalloprotease [Dehalococcoidia bacterium]|nr:CPBP family intramembrane metalloprotease [Dehalococcoidia bacterium]
MSEELVLMSPPAAEASPIPRIYGAWATIGISVAVIAVSLLALPLVVLLGFEVAEIAFDMNPVGYGMEMALTTIVTGISGMSLIYLVVRLKGNRGPAGYLGLKFQHLTWKTVFTALSVFLIVIFCIVSFGAIYEYLTGAPPGADNSDFMDNTYSSVGWWPMLWLATVVVAPVFEEAFFRGFMFVGLQRSRLRAVGVIILTSVVWACLHLQYNLFGIASILIMGLVLGVTRYKTGSLWCPIIVHAVWNALAFVIAAFL